MRGEETPRSNRLHIGLFGRRNTGKSSLVNLLTGQETALVSNVPGTTTDVVLKNIELPGIGAAVLVDTGGFDDEGGLGLLRVERAEGAAQKVDMALIVVCGAPLDCKMEKEWAARLEARSIPYIIIYNKMDEDGGRFAADWNKIWNDTEVLAVSARTGAGRDRLLAALARTCQKDEELDLTAGLAQEGDSVLLVMPQDKQAPKGRLILPQVQTLRNLLDKHCMVVCCTADGMQASLSALASPPDLIITDSQVFQQVEALCPHGTRLTSFSVLFARSKGDIRQFLQGAEAMMRLRPDARILIAEACTHVPAHEDIGRVKLPRLLRKKFGDALHIEVVAGNDFPSDLTGYDLLIHCGACMFTRRHVLSRLQSARECGVPATNYGIAIAALTGMLDRVAVPTD